MLHYVGLELGEDEPHEAARLSVHEVLVDEAHPLRVELVRGHAEQAAHVGLAGFTVSTPLFAQLTA